MENKAQKIIIAAIIVIVLLMAAFAAYILVIRDRITKPSDIAVEQSQPIEEIAPKEEAVPQERPQRENTVPELGDSTATGICPLTNCAADIAGRVARFEDGVVVVMTAVSEGELLDEPTERALSLPETVVAKHFDIKKRRYIDGERMNVGDFVQFALEEETIIEATVLK